MDDPVIELDAEQAALRRRDAGWVRECLAGDQHAFGRLYDAWFDRVYDLVSRIVRDKEVAAEVAQEAFFSAWRNLGTLENPDAFGGWLLRIARNGAYNRNQKEQRSYAVDDQGLTVIESVGASPTGAPSGFGVEDRLGRAATPGAAVEDAEVVSLVWEAAEALPERDVEVLDLQLRHGLTPAEIGEVMGMNRNAANQLVHRLKGRLETAIRARVLWRGGSPSCEVLAQRLRDLGIDRFSAEAVRVTERHVPGCIECDERQRLSLAPAALFAAVPMVAVPVAVKQIAAAGLAASGVPMAGSAFLTAAGIAGQAAGGVGSIAGGSVDPGVGHNIANAVSAPGVDPGVGSNVGHAIGGGNPGIGGNVGQAVGGSSSPVGSQAGSSVGSSIGSGPGSHLGGAAGESIAPPSPFDAAAGRAGDVAGAHQAAGAAGSVAPPTPMPPPPPLPPGDAGDGSGGGGAGAAPKLLALSAAAIGVLVLLFLGGLWWGGRDDGGELVASGAPTTEVSARSATTDAPGTTESGVTSTTTPGETTTSSDGAGDPSSTTVPTTVAPTTPTTRATNPTNPTNPTTPTTQVNPTTPTTRPTTTTTPPPKVDFSITNSPKTGDCAGGAACWYLTGPLSASSNPPVLSWSVSPPAGYTVEVTGPPTTAYDAMGAPTVQLFVHTGPSGSVMVCPGLSSNQGSGRICYVDPGSYVYTITVKNGAGQVVATANRELKVNPLIIG